MDTVFAKKGDVEKKWHLVDASGMVLGRLASKIATILRGKDKPIFTPHVDTGDFVIVINAEKVMLTGNKLQNKIYSHHSGYPGGLKQEALKDLMKRKPEQVITKAVWGMLPKNKLGRDQLKKLKVYRGAKHPHESQKPSPAMTGLK
ncbi:MAG TPA: 50S ribosomal protein L13 [Nitrospiraceae bacterium]|nr:50S ribosomal protein L13 [Nitrospiraceae bacterium]